MISGPSFVIPRPARATPHSHSQSRPNPSVKNHWSNALALASRILPCPSESNGAPAVP